MDGTNASSGCTGTMMAGAAGRTLAPNCLVEPPPEPLRHLQHTGGAADGPSDRRLRAGVFWAVLILTVMTLAAAHGYEKWIARPAVQAELTQKGGKPDLPLPFGSFGFYLAPFPRVSEGTRQVVVLGNSVYQNCGIVSMMQARAAAECRPLEFINRAQVGAGIHDHVVQAACVAPSRPSLIVIAFINIAFTPDYGRPNSLPRFRSDSNEMVFDPRVARQIPFSFYRREFTAVEMADAFLSSVFPLKRLEWMHRRQADLWLNDISLPLPNWVREQFPIPTLNLASEWMTRTDTPAPRAPKARLYPQTEQLLTELLTITQRCDVPVLFLRQESAPRFAVVDPMPCIRKVCSRFPRSFVVDFKDYYRPADQPDGVHPKPGSVGQVEYAKRHYDAVIATLANLGLEPLQAPGIGIEAEQFSRGNVRADLRAYGKGIGVIVSSAPDASWAEYDFDVDAAAEYRLSVRYAAATPRPFQIIIDGVQRGVIGDQVSGGWTPADQHIHHLAEAVPLEAGRHVLRVERRGVFPPIDRITLTRQEISPPSSAPSGSKPQRAGGGE